MVVHVLVDQQDVEEKCIHIFFSTAKNSSPSIFPCKEETLQTYANKLTSLILKSGKSEDDELYDVLFRMGRVFILLFARLNFFGPSCNSKVLTEVEERKIYEAAKIAGVLIDSDDKYPDIQIGDLLSDFFPILGHPDDISSSVTRKHAHKELSANGEYMYTICPGLPYFYIGKHIMTQLAAILPPKLAVQKHIWIARVCYIQQRLLHSDKWVICPSLRAGCLDVSLSLMCDIGVLKWEDIFQEKDSDDLENMSTISPLFKYIPQDVDKNDWPDAEVKCILFECALRLAVYGLTEICLKILDSIKKIMKVEYEFSGIMGIGREHQTESKSQLVVLTYDLSDGSKKPAGKFKNKAPDGDVPSEIYIRGDVPLKYVDPDTDILERPKLEDNEDLVTNLLSVDYQCLLLVHASLLKECLNVDDMLQTERLNAIINRVIEGATGYESDRKYESYSVISSALWFRCTNDMKRTNRQERGVVQLQALLDQFEDRAPPVSLYRMGTYLQHEYPTRIAAKEELVNYLLSIGAFNSAYEIYVDLGIHDRAAGCLIATGRVNEAEEYIQNRLKIEKTEQMLCLFGEVKGDSSYFLEAWELSDHRYAGAMRRLGNYEMKNDRIPEAIEAYNKALKLNNNFPSIYFTKGCLELQIQRYEEAIKSFRSCVLFDQDNAEAWANLTAAFINNSDVENAYRAVQQAVKWGRHQWKIIDSWMTIALKVGLKSDVLNAYNTLFDISGMKNIHIGKHRVAKDVIFNSIDLDQLEDAYRLLAVEPNTPIDFELRIAVMLINVFERILSEVDARSIPIYTLLSEIYHDIRIPSKEYEILMKKSVEMRAVIDKSNDDIFLENITRVLDDIQRAALLLRKRVDWGGVEDSDISEEKLLEDRSKKAAGMSQTILIMRQRTATIYEKRGVRFADQKVAGAFVDIRKVLKDIHNVPNL